MINIYILNYLKELLRCISNPTKKNTPSIMLRKIIHFRNIYNEFAFLIFPNDNNSGIIIYSNIIFEFKTSFFHVFCFIYFSPIISYTHSGVPEIICFPWLNLFKSFFLLFPFTQQWDVIFCKIFCDCLSNFLVEDNINIWLYFIFIYKDYKAPKAKTNSIPE